MAGRPGRLSDRSQQLEVAAMVISGREAGVLWKQLAWTLGRSREQLHRYVKVAEAEGIGCASRSCVAAGEKCNTAIVEPAERAVA